jgi:endo-1,4-beta-mannosidase
VILPLLSENDRFKMKSPLWDEKQAALYYEKTLTALYQQKVPAALAWCFADYFPYFWDLPPLKENHHERYFGLFRHDGSPKEAVGVIKEGNWQNISLGFNNGRDFLRDVQRDDFYRDPRKNLADMFAAYKAELKAGVS